MEYLFFLKNTKRENRFIPLKMEYLFFLKYTKGLSTVNPRYMNFYDVFYYAQNNDVKHKVYRVVPSINYIFDNLTSPILVVKCTEKLSIYQIRIQHETSRGQHIVPQSTRTSRPLSIERTGSVI